MKDKQEERFEFSPEFLNSIEIADLPPYEVKLKNSTIIVLMCNSGISNSMGNGTYMGITELYNSIIKAKV